MKKAKSRLMIMVLICLGIQQFLTAQKIYTIDDIPNLYLSNEKVADPEHLLSKDHLEKLQQQMQYMKDELHIDGAVVLLPEIKETTLVSNFSNDLYEKWNPDNRKSLLFVVVYGNSEQIQKMRQNTSGYRIQKTEAYVVVSQSLEDKIPNLLRLNIREEIENEETWGKGLIKGTAHLSELLKNEKSRLKLIKKLEEEDKANATIGFTMLGIMAILFCLILVYKGKRDIRKFNDPNPYLRYLKWEFPIWLANVPLVILSILLLPITLIFLIIWWFVKQKHTRLTCEKCGGHKVKRIYYNKIKDPEIKKKAYDSFAFKCDSCNHIHYEKEKIYEIRSKRGQS